MEGGARNDEEIKTELLGGADRPIISDMSLGSSPLDHQDVHTGY